MQLRANYIRFEEIYVYKYEENPINEETLIFF